MGWDAGAWAWYYGWGLGVWWLMMFDEAGGGGGGGGGGVWLDRVYRG